MLAGCSSALQLVKSLCVWDSHVLTGPSFKASLVQIPNALIVLFGFSTWAGGAW